MKEKEKLLFGNNGEKPGRKPNCVYCNSQEHNSLNCTEALDKATRRAILQKSGLCWNCTGGGHGVTQCKSRGCKNCNRKHHISICDQGKSTALDQYHNQRVEKSMSALMNHASTLHPTVLVKIGEEEVRLMFDSGAGSSYLCTDVITKLKLKPVRKEQRCIEHGTMRKIVEVYSVTVHSFAVEGFSIDVECINAEKHVLTHLPNPNIKAPKKQCGRFRRLTFSEEATRSDILPVHIILGAADYQWVRTTEPLILRVDPNKDPGAEFTTLGWTVYGRRPVTESVTAEKQFLLTTGQEVFEKRCSLDVLGLKYKVNKEQQRTRRFFPAAT